MAATMIAGVIILVAQSDPPEPDKPWEKGKAVVTIAWDPSPSPGVTHYGLVFSDLGPDIEINGAKWVYLMTENANTQSLTNFFPTSGKYWAAVYAVNSAGLTSDLSNVVEFDYKAQPLPPSGLKVSGSATAALNVPITVQLVWGD